MASTGFCTQKKACDVLTLVIPKLPDAGSCVENCVPALTYPIGERENHFLKYCPNLMVESCIFPDCKTYEPMKRSGFEDHLINSCGSKMKQCSTCDLDVYKIYENDEFRESAMGHLCERDCLLFLAESIIDGNQQMSSLDISMQSANSGVNQSSTNTSTMQGGAAVSEMSTSPRFLSGNFPNFRESLVIARKTIKLERVEYQEHTCQNGHMLHVVNISRDNRHANSTCSQCL